MKWIGQHIYDLVSRFRDDVYLEDISSGTIASGGNLGLDSNNKIVKATGGDLSGLSDVTPTNGDKLATLDSDGSTEQLTTVASLATLFAGTGLTAASSVIGVDASQPTITTLAGLTGMGATGVNLVMNYNDIQWYNAVDNGNPQLSIGSSATERFVIWPAYASGTQTLEAVRFATYTASGTANYGYFSFTVDETGILSIDDGGINIGANLGISINGVDILTDSSGTATLSNIDVATFGGVTIDKDRSGAAEENITALHVDFDRTVPTSGTNAHNDIGIDLDVTSASLGTSTLKGMDIDVVGATSGTSTATGIELNVSGADTNVGMQILCEGEQLRLSHNAADYATFTVADTGDLTIATVGDGSIDSDLTLDADGQIKLEPAAGKNILLDGTIAVDAGAVTGATSITSTAFVGTLSTASQPNVTTLAGVTTIGATGVNTVINSDDVQMYNPVVNGHPSFQIGATQYDNFRIRSYYDTDSDPVTLSFVEFTTYTTNNSADKGLYNFQVDQVSILHIDDGGIDFIANKGISIDGTDILTDSSGTATLSNIDALDATTEATIESAIDTLSNSITIDTDRSAAEGNDAAENITALHVDFDRTVPTSGTYAHNDIGIDLDVNSASLGTSSLIGMDIDVRGASSGTSTAYGIDLLVNDADTNIGMRIKTQGGTTHPQLKLEASADADDYATISVADTGDLVITTVGDGTTDSDLTLDADGDIILEAAGNDITMDTDNIAISSSTSAKPYITLTSTHTDKDQSAEIRFVKDAADTEDGENLGSINFYGEDEGNNQTKFAGITAEISESDETDEAGKLTLFVTESDGTGASSAPGLILEGEHATDGEVDVTIANGAGSTTTVAGDLTIIGSDLTFDSVALTAVQTSGESFVDNDTSIMTSAAIDDKINTKYANSIIAFEGQATMLSSGNWVGTGKPGIGSHTWNKDYSVNTETNGTTEATVPKQWAQGGVRVPFACIIDGISCIISNASNNNQATVGLFFARAADGTTAVDWGDNSDTEPILQIHADANNESGSYTGRPARAEVTGSDIAMAAGDVFYPAIKLTGVTSGGATDVIYASFSVHVKTLIA